MERWPRNRPPLLCIQPWDRTNCIKCQVHPGATVCQTDILHPRVVWQRLCLLGYLHLLSCGFFLKLYKCGSFKGQHNFLWWGAKQVQCTFSPENRSILMWPPPCGISKKSTLIKGKHHPDLLGPCLQTPSVGIHTIFNLTLLYPLNLEWCSSMWVVDILRDAEISILCGLMHFTKQPSL